MTTFENEANVAVVDAEQCFDFSPIEGSTITGAVTNTQTQIVVNLAFDEFELDLPLISGVELDLNLGTTSLKKSEGNNLNVKIDKSGAFINGKELIIDKKDVGNGKKVITFKYDNQELNSEENSPL